MNIDKYVTNIRNRGQLVIKELGPISGITFGFNKESVRWVEGYIERCRNAGEKEGDFDGLINSLGSFLGECIVKNAGGEWRWFEEQQTIGVVLPTGDGVFPFAKTRKQFAKGLRGGDSVYSFYDIAVNFMANGLLQNAKPVPRG